MAPEPTLFVVDDNADLRASLRWLLESVGHAVETFASAQAFLDGYDPRRAGVLILDVRMPGVSGVELQTRLNALGADLAIIFLTGYANVQLAVQAMRDGAADLFEKPVDEQRLLDRVQQLIEAIGERLGQRQQQEIVEARLALLIPREREVLDLVLAGRRTKEAATDLGLSPKTVEVHRAKLLEKMRVRSVAELVSVVLSHPASRGSGSA